MVDDDARAVIDLLPPSASPGIRAGTGVIPVVYEVPKRQTAFGPLIMLMLGGVGLLFGWVMLHAWMHTGRLPEGMGRLLVVVPGSPVLIGVGVWNFVLLRTRSVRLEISSSRVVYRTLPRDDWAEWTGVGHFSVSDMNHKAVVAHVTGTSASPDALKKGKLEILAFPFDLDAVRLADTLNEAREAALA